MRWHLKQVLTMLKYSGVTIKIEKCSLLSERIDYLGHIIRHGCSEIANAMKIAIEELRDPTNYIELPSFLGFVTCSGVSYIASGSSPQLSTRNSAEMSRRNFKRYR